LSTPHTIYNTNMFTIDQIKAAHSNVKSGADFPQYIQDVKALGVTSYSQYVTDGHTIYNGNGHRAEAPAKYDALTIAKTGNGESLKQVLKIHQAGETDYLTFCSQAAGAGVEKWIVDAQKMTCAYYDLAGNEMIVEVIPGA